MTDQKNDDLLPCPFCGHDAVYIAYGQDRHQVDCGNPEHCLACAGTPTLYTKEGAYKAWNTRAQTVEDDAGLPTVADWVTAPPHGTYDGLKCQFRALKIMVNSMGQQLSFYQKKSYETGEQHLAALQESLESERAMNAALTEELALRQPPAADNRGVDVEALKDKAPDGHKQDCICIRCERKNAWNDCLDHLSTRGLLRTTPEDAKGDGLMGLQTRAGHDFSIVDSDGTAYCKHCKDVMTFPVKPCPVTKQPEHEGE